MSGSTVMILMGILFLVTLAATAWLRLRYREQLDAWGRRHLALRHFPWGPVLVTAAMLFDSQREGKPLPEVVWLVWGVWLIWFVLTGGPAIVFGASRNLTDLEYRLEVLERAKAAAEADMERLCVDEKKGDS